MWPQAALQTKNLTIMVSAAHPQGIGIRVRAKVDGLRQVRPQAAVQTMNLTIRVSAAAGRVPTRYMD